MSPDAQPLCAACSEPTTKTCGGCKSIRYCSKACQEIDRPVHKLLCKAFAKFDDSSRPDDKHIKAIFFPVDDQKPNLIWLPWEDNGSCDAPLFGTVLGPDPHDTAISIPHSPFLHRDLENAIWLGHRERYGFDGSKINKSISNLESRNPRPHVNGWRGPVVAYVMVGPDGLSCKDIDMNDFCHIADFLVWYNMDSNPFPNHYLIEKVRGVRINCYGDQQMLKKPRFERTEVFTTDPIFSNGHTSDIADAIGLGIFTRRLTPDPRWANDRTNPMFHKSPFDNPEAAKIHICCDPKSNVIAAQRQGPHVWGKSTLPDDVGSVLVVRQDKKLLTPLTAEGLYEYAIYGVEPDLEKCDVNGKPEPGEMITTEKALEQIDAAGFYACWDEMRVQKNPGEEHYDADPFKL